MPLPYQFNQPSYSSYSGFPGYGFTNTPQLPGGSYPGSPYPGGGTASDGTLIYPPGAQYPYPGYPGNPIPPSGNSGNTQIGANQQASGNPSWLDTIAPYLGLGLLGTGLAGNIANAQAYGSYQDILSNIYKTYGQGFQPQLDAATSSDQSYSTAQQNLSGLPSWYWSMAQNLGSLTPQQSLSGINTMTQGLDDNLVKYISNKVQGEVGSRGLSDSPATFSTLMAQELAPYVQQNQQLGSQNYWDTLKAFETVPIPNLQNPLANPQLPPGVQPMPPQDLSGLIQMLLGGKGGMGSNSPSSSQNQVNPTINVYGGSAYGGQGGSGMGGQGGFGSGGQGGQGSQLPPNWNSAQLPMPPINRSGPPASNAGNPLQGGLRLPQNPGGYSSSNIYYPGFGGDPSYYGNFGYGYPYNPQYPNLGGFDPYYYGYEGSPYESVDSKVSYPGYEDGGGDYWGPGYESGDYGYYGGGYQDPNYMFDPYNEYYGDPWGGDYGNYGG